MNIVRKHRFIIIACVYWKSDLDYEKATMVISAQKINWEYLQNRTRQKDTESKLL